MSYKTFDLAHDVASLVSSVNEVVRISSSLYTTAANVKHFASIVSGATTSGYWQTVYDSAASSSQSTALFDLSFGIQSGSGYQSAPYATEKTKVYRQLASSLLGNIDGTFNDTWKECFFIMFKRNLMKDEIKKGMTLLGLGAAGTVQAADTGAATTFKQTVGGDYAPLFSGSTVVGQVYYNAGVVVLPASASGLPWNPSVAWSGALSLSGAMSGTIDQAVDGLRANVASVQMNNQTNLYSTVYFCRATNTEFNYSSNPTFVDADKRIRVTSGSNVMQSRTYITTVGLYDASDNLLAVGKLNKPITKSPDTEAIFRIRLDY